MEDKICEQERRFLVNATGTRRPDKIFIEKSQEAFKNLGIRKKVTTKGNESYSGLFPTTVWRSRDDGLITWL